METVWSFVCKWWWLLLAFLAGLLGLFLGSRGPLWRVQDELKVIDIGEQTKLMEAQRGAQMALEYQNRLYMDKMSGLTDAQVEKANSLLHNPPARARYLARVSRKRPGDVI